MIPRIVVVGLGPAGADLTTVGARERLASLEQWRLRTRHHPAALAYVDRPSYDDLYESADTFDDVYAGIVEDLVALATRHGEAGYAVPGSPFVLESAVRRLLADDRVAVEVVAGMSFLDLAWSHVRADPVEAGVRLVDGHRFSIDAAGATGALLVAHCHANHVLSDIKLAYDDDEPDGAIILQRLGLDDEAITEVDWADLDRAVAADHLTSIFIPAVTAPVGAELIRFDELVRNLRTSCDWDSKQTHASLRRYVLEEAYEVADAIDGVDEESGEGTAHLAEELGDLLFQVYFHSTIASERGDFTLGEVARGIHDKLVRRHPHVFDTRAGSAGTAADWEAQKMAEKGRSSVMDGIPSAMGALAFADKVLAKVERMAESIPELADVVDDGGDLGRALFGLVVAARSKGLDAEAELRAVVRDVRDQVVSAELGGVVHPGSQS